MDREVTIYFIQWGKGGPIKIGRARDLYRRLSELQIACFVDLRVLYHFQGHPDVELSFHEILAPHRLRGEWFKRKPVLELLEVVRGKDWTDVHALLADMLLDADAAAEIERLQNREPPLHILRKRTSKTIGASYG